MRFHSGAVPEDPDFQPEAEGWRSIREPGPWMMQLIALPAAIILLLVSGALLYLVLPNQFSLDRQLTGGLPPGWLVAILVLVIPVHELIHAVLHPGWGFSSNSIIGLWSSRLLFYAHYEGAMSRNRFLLVFAGPYLVLSLLPVAAIAALRVLDASLGALAALALLSLWAGALASGDFVGFWLILSQIPNGALVRNKGWKTYWKPPAIHS